MLTDYNYVTVYAKTNFPGFSPKCQDTNLLHYRRKLECDWPFHFLTTVAFVWAILKRESAEAAIFTTYLWLVSAYTVTYIISLLTDRLAIDFQELVSHL